MPAQRTEQHVPYAQRLARESVKFGLRVGGSLFRHGPGLFAAGLVGLPFAILGLGRKDEDEPVQPDESFIPLNWKSGYLYDENGNPGIVPQDELDRYHNGFI